MLSVHLDSAVLSSTKKSEKEQDINQSVIVAFLTGVANRQMNTDTVQEAINPRRSQTHKVTHMPRERERGIELERETGHEFLARDAKRNGENCC